MSNIFCPYPLFLKDSRVNSKSQAPRHKDGGQANFKQNTIFNDQKNNHESTKVLKHEIKN